MAAAIGPGDWVECVRCRDGSIHFTVGAIYEVAEVGQTKGCKVCGECRVGVRIAGKPRPKDVGFKSRWIAGCCFRPIYRPKQSIIEALKAPVTRTPKVVKPIREDA